MLTVYTTDSCAYCPMVKKYLTLKGVEYTEVNVSTDPNTRAELFAKTGLMTVPVTTNGKDFVVGWQPQKLADLTR